MWSRGRHLLLQKGGTRALCENVHAHTYGWAHACTTHITNATLLVMELRLPASHPAASVLEKMNKEKNQPPPVTCALNCLRSVVIRANARRVFLSIYFCGGRKRPAWVVLALSKRVKTLYIFIWREHNAACSRCCANCGSYMWISYTACYDEY